MTSQSLTSVNALLQMIVASVLNTAPTKAPATTIHDMRCLNRFIVMHLRSDFSHDTRALSAPTARAHLDTIQPEQGKSNHGKNQGRRLRYDGEFHHAESDRLVSVPGIQRELRQQIACIGIEAEGTQCNVGRTCKRGLRKHAEDGPDVIRVGIKLIQRQVVTRRSGETTRDKIKAVVTVVRWDEWSQWRQRRIRTESRQAVIRLHGEQTVCSVRLDAGDAAIGIKHHLPVAHV